MNEESRRYLDNSIVTFVSSKGTNQKVFTNFYFSYSLQQQLKSNLYFRYSRFFGTYDNHVYSGEVINNDYLILFDIDLNNQTYIQNYIYVGDVKNIVCYYQYNNQICNYVVNDFYNNHDVSWYPRFIDSFNNNIVLTSDVTNVLSGSYKVGTSYLDDLMYSNRSTDILVYGFYLFIPILLFILLIKVFRKGLFK